MDLETQRDEQSLLTPASLLMCDSDEELKRKTAWDGAQGESREQLLAKLSRMFVHARVCWILLPSCLT